MGGVGVVAADGDADGGGEDAGEPRQRARGRAYFFGVLVHVVLLEFGEGVAGGAVAEAVERRAEEQCAGRDNPAQRQQQEGGP